MVQLYDDGLLFEESQSVGPRWVWRLVLGIQLAVFAAIVIGLVIAGEPETLGPDGESTQAQTQQAETEVLGSEIEESSGSETLWFVGIVAILVFSPTLLMSRLRLRTTVDPDQRQLVVRMTPFAKRMYSLDDIKQAEGRSYQAIAEFGGWGVRRANGRKAYTAQGTQGVELTLASDEVVLIGTQRPRELIEALSGTGVAVVGDRPQNLPPA